MKGAELASETWDVGGLQSQRQGTVLRFSMLFPYSAGGLQVLTTVQQRGGGRWKPGHHRRDRYR